MIDSRTKSCGVLIGSIESCMAIKPTVTFTVDAIKTYTNKEENIQKRNRRNFDRTHFVLQTDRSVYIRILEESASIYRLGTRLSVINYNEVLVYTYVHFKIMIRAYFSEERVSSRPKSRCM